MKLQKYLLGAAIAIMSAMFVSCDKDNIAATYSPYTDNVTFMSKESANILTSDATCEIPVRIVRAKKNGAYEVKYNIEVSEDGIFTDLSNNVVTFADGESVTYINLKAENLQYGETYEALLILDDASIAKADTMLKSCVDTTSVIVTRDYEWVNAGTCTFVDYIFAESDDGTSVDGVEIENATVNGTATNIYRICSPYTALYGGVSAGGFANADFKFTFNSEDNSIQPIKSGDIIYEFNDGADIYQLAWPEQYTPDYCYVDQLGNDYYISSLVIISGDGYYGPWGFEFIWDEGWPGEK